MSENFHATKLRCSHKRYRIWLDGKTNLAQMICSWCGSIQYKFGKRESIAVFNLYRAGMVTMKKRASCAVSNTILPEEL